MPQAEAGLRTDPPVSVPSAIGKKPAATPAPDPEEEPPADDDVPARTGPPIEELPEGMSAADAQAQHDMNVANDWRET